MHTRTFTSQILNLTRRYHPKTQLSDGCRTLMRLKGGFNTPTHAEGTINVFFTYPHNALPPCNETDPFSATHRA